MNLPTRHPYHHLMGQSRPALLAIGLMLPSLVSAQLFTVNSTGDDPVAALDGQCATGNLINGEPECTLRAALQEANQAGGEPVQIQFNIADCPEGQCLIEIDTQAGSSLPLIERPVLIDGSTQPGNTAVCQSDPVDRPAYAIALQGLGDDGSYGLKLGSGSSGSEIRGLNIRNFEHGIMMIASNDNRIECNYLGSNSRGMLAGPGNLMSGVFLACNSAGNTIGGSAAGQANLIVANGSNGVQIFGGYICGDQPEDNMPTNNAVLGNVIGVAADGISALGNGLAGIAIFGGPGADHNLIGVLQDRETIRGNVIGFNGTSGLYIDSDGEQGRATEHTVVQGNYFGTDRNGQVNLGNLLGGIDIIRGASTKIGGSESAQANVFAFNDDGVYMERQISNRNHLQRNVMYANQRRAIVLQDGHEFDPEGTGPNRMQTAPQISSSFSNGGVISIIYSVPEAVENLPLLIEFFLADGEREQGRLFLTDHLYPTAGSSTLQFSSTLINVGQFLVATATDSLGNTSEFSTVSALLGEVPPAYDQIFQDRFQ